MKSLFWTTDPNAGGCVNPYEAGFGFYNLSIYAKNDLCKTLFRFTGVEQHCIFSDSGCNILMPCMGAVSEAEKQADYATVAQSIAAFVEDKPLAGLTSFSAQHGACPKVSAKTSAPVEAAPELVGVGGGEGGGEGEEL
jgi:hypothetical protein